MEMRTTVFVVFLGLLAVVYATTEDEKVDTLKALAQKRRVLGELIDEIQDNLTPEQRLQVYTVPELHESNNEHSIEKALKFASHFPSLLGTVMDRSAHLNDQWRVLHSGVKSEASDLRWLWMDTLAEVQKLYIQIMKVRQSVTVIKSALPRVEQLLKQPPFHHRHIEEALDYMVRIMWDEIRWYSPVIERLHLMGGVTPDNVNEPILSCSGCEKSFNRGHLVRRIRPESPKESILKEHQLDASLNPPYKISYKGLPVEPKEESWSEWANRVGFPRPRHCDASCVWEEYVPKEDTRDEL